MSDRSSNRNARDKRLAEALRVNLRRRKEQSRAKDEAADGGGSQGDDVDVSHAASIQPQEDG